MACPFRSLWRREPEPAPTQTSSCPFASFSLSASSASAARPATQTNTNGGSGCSDRTAHKDCSVSPQTSQQCPYGFSNKGPKLSEMHCIVCRSLLFNCVTVNCSHIFCRACIGRFGLCPLCGEDVTSSTPNTELQAVVDTFVTGHCDTLSLWELEQVDIPDGSAVQLETAKATFFLHLGLRSLSGGNWEAAASRFQEAKAALEQRGDKSAELHCQLGSLAGQEGDCHRLMGDIAKAQQCYNESVEHLKQSQEENFEVWHALSVSLNKLGDLHYSQNDLQAAQQSYNEALILRRKLATKAKALGKQVQADLDVAVSLVKLADVLKEIGEAGAASKLLQEAQELGKTLQGAVPDCEPLVQAKFESFIAALKDLQKKEV